MAEGAGGGAGAPSLAHYFGSEGGVTAFEHLPDTTSPASAPPLAEVNETTANLFPCDPAASFNIKQDLPSPVLPSTSVSSAAALPATNLPDPSTFFDNITSDVYVSPKGVTTKPSGDFLVQSMDTLTIKDSQVNSELERRQDAWIPSEETKKTLLKAQSAPKGSFFPEREVLTTPGIILEEELPDHLQETAVKLLGAGEAASRGALRHDRVSRDEAGLRELIRTGCYRAAISLTSTLISALGQGVVALGRASKHSPRSLQLWLSRFTLMSRLRMYDIMSREAEAFGDLGKPDMFYQFYPEAHGSRAGSLVPFSLRLLVAELPSHTGKPEEALDRLYLLLAVIRKMLSNLRSGTTEDGSSQISSEQDRAESVRLWTDREASVMHSVLNCAVSIKDYGLAISTAARLRGDSDAQKRTLLSTLCRLCLQAGRLRCAEKYLQQATALRNQTCPMPDVQEYMDLGLLEVAQGRHQEAYNNFAKAAEQEPTNITVANNSAVCLLYMGKLKDAIAVLQKAIHTDPERGLHESLLVNLCTLYELESSKTQEKKLNLLRMLCKYKSDTIPNVLECLKLV